MQAATGATGVKITQNNGPAAGQVVPQLHFHVVPVGGESAVAAIAAAAAQDDLQDLRHEQQATEVQQQQSKQNQQNQQNQQQPNRMPLDPGSAGPLLASLRNALPASHSGAGVHVWLSDAAAMERLGAALLMLCAPGTVLLLQGHLGAGKTSIARGLVRAFTRDPGMFVPSPTFLLCLTYEEDNAHRSAAGGTNSCDEEPGGRLLSGELRGQPAAAAAGASGASGAGDDSRATTRELVVAAAAVDCQQQQQQHTGGTYEQPASINGIGRCAALRVHHMDPYRLGAPDRMAGLLDFESAFQNDISIIEWPSKMPASVMALPRRCVWHSMLHSMLQHKAACNGILPLLLRKETAAAAAAQGNCCCCCCARKLLLLLLLP